MDALPFDPSLLGVSVSGDLGPLTIYQTKRGKTVAFPKAPPKCPPTPAQNSQRYRFRKAIENWQLLSDAQQHAYEHVVSVLSICMTGVNLWIHFSLMREPASLRTLERQSDTLLTSPPYVR